MNAEPELIASNEVSAPAYTAEVKTSAGGRRIGPIAVVLSQHWYHHRYGIDFSEETWLEPLKRVEMYADMAKAAYKAYGWGSSNPPPFCSIDAYGHRITSVMFGCKPVYHRDQAPAVAPLPATAESLLALEPLEVELNPVVEKAKSDKCIYEAKYGKGCVSGGFVNASPLNGCVSTWGEAFIAAAYEAPEAAQHAMRIFGKMSGDMYTYLSHEIDPDHFPLPRIHESDGLGNCPALMFSPELYHRVFVPIDLETRREVKYFGIHHCGVIDRYLDVYGELSPTSFDIGGNSDYKLLRRKYPEITVSLMINGPIAESMKAEDVDTFIYDMVRDAGPVDKISFIYVTDVAAGVNDEVIRRIATAHERLVF